MAMAIFDSVTVSIAAEIKGIDKLIFFVILVFTFASAGNTEDFAGSSNTSSKVIPSRIFISTP